MFSQWVNFLNLAKRFRRYLNFTFHTSKKGVSGFLKQNKNCCLLPFIYNTRLFQKENLLLMVPIYLLVYFKM